MTVGCLSSVFRSRPNPNCGKNENFLGGRFDESELRIGFSRFLLLLCLPDIRPVSVGPSDVVHTTGKSPGDRHLGRATGVRGDIAEESVRSLGRASALRARGVRRKREQGLVLGCVMARSPPTDAIARARATHRNGTPLVMILRSGRCPRRTSRWRPVAGQFVGMATEQGRNLGRGGPRFSPTLSPIP
jgi:hypothetical protein